jgi:hypothetical protein
MTPLNNAHNASGWNETLADEHHQLRTLLEYVDELLSRPGGPGHRREMLLLLTELADLCREHMRSEEQGGYLVSVRERIPGSSEAVEKLQREHVTLQNDLRDMLNILRCNPDAKTFEQDLVPRLNQWLAAIRSHEHQENALTQEAFNLDIGAGD